MKRLITYILTMLIVLTASVFYSPLNLVEQTLINDDSNLNNEDSIFDNNQDADNNKLVEEDIPVAQFNIEDYDYAVMSLVNLNVRAEASSSSNIIGLLYKNSQAMYIDTVSNNWYKVFYNDTFGYVSSKAEYTYLFNSKNGNHIDSVINTGYEVLGKPYEYGSQRILLYNGQLNPNFTGDTLDCSAFIQYIFYEGAGIKLAGDSRSQSLNGTLIPYSEMRKGDLLFMYSSSRINNTGLERIGHVAMFIGDNKILHTFGTGGVRVQELSEFWRERIISIKRMV